MRDSSTPAKSGGAGGAGGAGEPGEPGGGGCEGTRCNSPGGQRPGRSERRSPAPRPRRPGGSPAARLLSSPGHPRQREGYRRAPPGLFPAPRADMAADELSHSWLRAPAAPEARTPPGFPPRLLRAPLPAARPTEEHRVRAAREEAPRAGDHRVPTRTHPESPVHS